MKLDKTKKFNKHQKELTDRPALFFDADTSAGLTPYVAGLSPCTGYFFPWTNVQSGRGKRKKMRISIFDLDAEIMQWKIKQTDRRQHLQLGKVSAKDRTTNHLEKTRSVTSEYRMKLRGGSVCPQVIGRWGWDPTPKIKTRLHAPFKERMPYLPRLLTIIIFEQLSYSWPQSLGW